MNISQYQNCGIFGIINITEYKDRAYCFGSSCTYNDEDQHHSCYKCSDF